MCADAKFVLYTLSVAYFGLLILFICNSGNVVYFSSFRQHFLIIKLFQREIISVRNRIVTTWTFSLKIVDLQFDDGHCIFKYQLIFLTLLMDRVINAECFRCTLQKFLQKIFNMFPFFSRKKRTEKERHDMPGVRALWSLDSMKFSI